MVETRDTHINIERPKKNFVIVPQENGTQHIAAERPKWQSYFYAHPIGLQDCFAFLIALQLLLIKPPNNLQDL